VPLAQLAWTENTALETQATRAYGQAQRTGTHDEIIGGLDEALAGVEGYGASNGCDINYKNNSKEQSPTLTSAYLTSSNVSTQNHAPATVNYYHCDQIGTPRELTDELGAVTWSATYRAWGRVEKEQSYLCLICTRQWQRRKRVLNLAIDSAATNPPTTALPRPDQ
jgi:uncharacterized protein RhaS with RHS repeats